MMVRGDSPECDWNEDDKHENGNYFNLCCQCECMFTGHKRRVVCKRCHNENLVEKK